MGLPHILSTPHHVRHVLPHNLLNKLKSVRKKRLGMPEIFKVLVFRYGFGTSGRIIASATGSVLIKLAGEGYISHKHIIHKICY